MVRVKDHSLALALCLSLIGHGLMLRALAAQYARTFGHISTAALPHAEEPTAPIIVPALPPPPDSTNEMGESTGKGSASHSIDGDQPLRGRKGDEDQAFLSRDPEGPGKVGDLPSPSQMIPGQGGANGSPAAGPSQLDPLPFGPTQPEEALATPAPKLPADAAVSNSPPSPPLPPPPPAPKHEDVTDPKLASAPPPAPPSPEAQRIDADKTPPTPDSPPALQPPPPPPQPIQIASAMPTPPPVPQPREAAKPSTPPGRPGPPVPAADPAPESDSESDAFTRDGTFDISGTKAVARFGRKVKTVRPRIALAGQFDLMTMQNPSIVLRVDIDATGKVTNVEVLQSSGSISVDLPVEQAIYQWWIEPAKNKAGKPVPDAMVWRINFR